MMRRILTALLLLLSPLWVAFSQNKEFQTIYEEFKRAAQSSYTSFRKECNKAYADFLRTAWGWYDGKAPLPKPKDLNPIPPKPYNGDENNPIAANPVEVNPIECMPQPKPIEPIRERTVPEEKYFSVAFFGDTCKVRMPEAAKLSLMDVSPISISNVWERLCVDDMNNAIRDCLEIRIRYSLCDWAYLLFLDKLCSKFNSDKNGATLLMAFLYCQSGYQMRMAIDGNSLIMLYGSKHQIYNKGYFAIDGSNFYPYGEPSRSIQICNASFEGETPMSLLISSEQLLGGNLSQPRQIFSKKYIDVSVKSRTPLKLIEFFNEYPTSEIGENPMTRWAMYANTPLSQKTKDAIYPSLKQAIEDCTKLEAANKLLNWVQTGFVYEYDDKVWEHDRAFFAEETLYYPYADCEDRSILFSRLVRDLLGLDVALVFYPEHLATAVCFNEEVRGDAMMIRGRKFIVCDPTYIGAPVGVQMPDLEYDKTQAIVLKR